MFLTEVIFAYVFLFIKKNVNCFSFVPVTKSFSVSRHKTTLRNNPKKESQRSLKETLNVRMRTCLYFNTFVKFLPLSVLLICLILYLFHKFNDSLFMCFNQSQVSVLQNVANQRTCLKELYG